MTDSERIIQAIEGQGRKSTYEKTFMAALIGVASFVAIISYQTSVSMSAVQANQKTILANMFSKSEADRVIDRIVRLEDFFSRHRDNHTVIVKPSKNKEITW